MICSKRIATWFHKCTSGMPCFFGAGVGSAARPCLSMFAAGCGAFGRCSSEKNGPKMAENHGSRKKIIGVGSGGKCVRKRLRWLQCVLKCGELHA